MDRVDERELVINLLKQGDNAKTIKRIMDNFPDLGDPKYVSCWKEIVHKVTSVPKREFDFVKYPKSRGETKELMIAIRSWKEGGLPFTLMLYGYQKSAVRVQLYKDEYLEFRNGLNEFANANADIVGNFPQIKGWSVWHSVLKSHGNLEYPEELLVGESDFFEESYWAQVQERLEHQLKNSGLLDRINRWLSSRRI